MVARFGKGTIDLINRIEDSNIRISNIGYSNIKNKYANKINNVKIKSLKRNKKAINRNIYFKYIIKATLAIIVLYPLGYIIGLYLGEKELNFDMFFSIDLNGITIVCLITLLLVFIIQFIKYKKNNNDWKTLWQEFLEFGVEGDHDSIMDTLFHTVKNSKFNVTEFDLEQGWIKGRRWWWYSRVIEIEKNTDNLVRVKISYRYPYQVILNEFSNLILLRKFKKQLLKGFKY